MAEPNVGTAESRPQSKLEEQANGKAEYSYSYWARSQSTGTATMAPKKLTEEEARAQEEAVRGANAAGASAWNHAGTFEERNVTAWAKTELEGMLVGVSHEWAGGSVRTSSMDSCTGDAHVWIVRGKRRGGFEFDMKLGWTAEVRSQGNNEDPTTVTGTLQIPNACPDDLDELVLTVTLEGGSDPRQGHEESALQAARALLEPLRQQLSTFAARLKET